MTFFIDSGLYFYLCIFSCLYFIAHAIILLHNAGETHRTRVSRLLSAMRAWLVGRGGHILLDPEVS